SRALMTFRPSIVFHRFRNFGGVGRNSRGGAEPRRKTKKIVMARKSGPPICGRPPACKKVSDVGSGSLAAICPVCRSGHLTAVAVKEREATAARGAAGVLDGSEHGAKLVRLGRSFMLLP